MESLSSSRFQWRSRPRPGSRSFVVRTRGRETPFELQAQAPVQAVQVDPQFDVFRFLDAREIPPSIGQIFGEPEILALLPSRAPAAQLTAYRQLMEGWQSDSHRISVQMDEDMSEMPADRAVWILGRENLHAGSLAEGAVPGLELAQDGVVVGGESVPTPSTPWS